MKCFGPLAFALSWLIACDTPSAPTMRAPLVDRPSLEKFYNVKADFASVELNPCPPEEFVAVEGSSHMHVTRDITPTGYQETFYANFQGVKGVGLTSGDQYSFLVNQKNHWEVSYTPDGLEQEADLRVRLIRQGSNDNMWFRQTIRITSPPYQFEIIRSEIECRG